MKTVNRANRVVSVLFAGLIAASAFSASPAQASAPAAPATAPAPHQMRPEHDLRTYGAVETIPGMESVRVRASVPYKTAGGRILTMNIYSPADAAAGAAPRPAVIFINGVGDWAGQTPLKEWGQYTSWPRLAAASGYVAIAFDARSAEDGANAEDVRDAFAYAHEHASELRIDPARLAAWACSANVAAALNFLMGPPSPPGVIAAVLYYGGVEGQTIRADLPVFLVRAGKDRPEQNQQIDRMAAKAAEVNAPWTVLNLPSAHHAFDVLDDNADSRTAIRQTLAFLRDRFAPPAPTAPPSAARAALAHFFGREWTEAETAYASYVAAHPDDADAWTLLGNARVELKKPDEAAVSLRKAIALDPGIGEAWAMLGRIEADKKNYPEAERILNHASALMPDDSGTRFQLGKVYLAQKRTAEAIPPLEQAVQLDPGNGWAWSSLAMAYYQAGQYDKAASAFDRVLPFASENPGLLYNAACANSLSGRKDRALELLSRAVEHGFKDKAGLTSDPDLAALREDPRFQEIVRKMS